MRSKLAAVATILTIAACGSDPDVASGPIAYPPTGVTKTIELTASDVTWQTDVGALYNAWTYNGTIPGPQIDVTAGDAIVIQLTNPTDHPVSIHTHLVEFDQAEDGSDPPSIAMPGQTVTVHWQTRYAGAVPYHDHGSHEGVARGLIGALIVHAPDEPSATENVVVMSDFDPVYYRQLPGIADPITGMISTVGEYRGPHQYLHIVNGKAYDAISVFAGKVGELSRWRVISIGINVHTWHLHGQRWIDPDGTLTDNIQLSPGMYQTFELTPERAGSWLVHCHFPEHMEGGMVTRFNVLP